MTGPKVLADDELRAIECLADADFEAIKDREGGTWQHHDDFSRVLDSHEAWKRRAEKAEQRMAQLRAWIVAFSWRDVGSHPGVFGRDLGMARYVHQSWLEPITEAVKKDVLRELDRLLASKDG